MNDDIRPYIHPKPPPPPPHVPPGVLPDIRVLILCSHLGMVNFTDNPILELLDFVLNTAVGASGPLGLNRVFSIITSMNSCHCSLSTYFADGTGNLAIAGTESMQYTFSTEQVNVTIGALSISISGNSLVCSLISLFTALNCIGLNTWKDFDIFKASQNYTLNSFTDLDFLDLNVSFFVNLSFNQSVFMGSSVYEG
jgi:hypothetical protein